MAAIARLPRGIPAASLKHQPLKWRKPRRVCLPRGIPAASLKHAVVVRRLDELSLVFRGEYPRPH